MGQAGQKACSGVTVCHVCTHPHCGRGEGTWGTPHWAAFSSAGGGWAPISHQIRLCSLAAARVAGMPSVHTPAYSLITSLCPLSLTFPSFSLEKTRHCSSFLTQQGCWELLLSSAPLHLPWSIADVQAQIWIADLHLWVSSAGHSVPGASGYSAFFHTFGEKWRSVLWQKKKKKSHSKMKH